MNTTRKLKEELMRELKEELKMTSSGRKFLEEIEHCEDAVSREDAIKAVDRHTFDTDDGLCLDEDISIILEELPPVKPTRKKGYWIMTNDFYTGTYGTIVYVKCSCCGEKSIEEGNFCPNCGAEMGSEEE